MRRELKTPGRRSISPARQAGGERRTEAFVRVDVGLDDLVPNLCFKLDDRYASEGDRENLAESCVLEPCCDPPHVVDFRQRDLLPIAAEELLLESVRPVWVEEAKVEVGGGGG